MISDNALLATNKTVQAWKMSAAASVAIKAFLDRAACAGALEKLLHGFGAATFMRAVTDVGLHYGLVVDGDAPWRAAHGK